MGDWIRHPTRLNTGTVERKMPRRKTVSRKTYRLAFMMFLEAFDWYLKISFPSALSATLLLACDAVAEQQDCWFQGLATSPLRQQTPITAMFQVVGIICFLRT